MRFFFVLIAFPILALSNPFRDYRLEGFFKPTTTLKYQMNEDRYVCAGDIRNKGAFFIQQFKLRYPDLVDLSEVEEEIHDYFNTTLEVMHSQMGDLVEIGGLRPVECIREETINGINLSSKVMHFINFTAPYSVPVGMAVFSWRINDTAFLLQVTLVASTSECSMLSMYSIAKEICRLSNQ